ncbi:putative ribonuclease H protein [Vitis vinifera]|uniref:Putative ribonuclease H protein n=1 Tax=Vitis vinifera TaxID=29760 RepID=A0A438GVX3_VITVI|nr:putative ribonuclease H protein [Vitis vinifera]
MEVFSSMMRRAISGDEMTYLSWLLMWFEACSGLRINLEKSEMIPVGRVLNIRVWLGVGKSEVRLEKIQRDFLWGGGTLAHKPHLVRWNLVCLEKRKGGLGVRNLSLMNNALLCKWNWRFANERDALWRSVISLKYGVEEGGWCTRDVMGRNECLGFEVWNPVGDGSGWTPLFARAFNDWEIDLVERLQKIQAFRVQREEEDRVIWTASNNGAFSVRSLYSMMEPGAFLCSLVERIWKVRVPPKVAFFAWEASWGKVLTQEQLQRRGFSLANRCFLCLSEEETVDHLLLHCVKTRVLWNLLFFFLDYLGLFHVQLRQPFLGGMEGLWEKDARRLGKWRLYVFFGQFGRREIG